MDDKETFEEIAEDTTLLENDGKGCNEQMPEQNDRIITMGKYIAAGLGIIAFLVLITIFFCNMSGDNNSSSISSSYEQTKADHSAQEKKLKKDVADRNFDKVVQFIQDNMTSTESKDIISYAVSEIVKQNNKTGLAFLEKTFIDDWAPVDIRLEIIKNYNTNNLKFEANESEICKVYDTVTFKSSDELTKELVKMMKKYDAKIINAEILSIVKASYLSGGAFEAVTKSKGFREIVNSDSLNRLVTLLSSLSEKDNDLNDANSQLSNLQAQLTEAQNYVTQFQYFDLNAYIVQDLGNNQYEIAMPESSYLGKVPSSTHAYLIAQNTQFSSKGWFTLPVINGISQNVKLKEEFGSFTQKWDVYIEVTKQQIDQLNDFKNNLSTTKETIKGTEERIKTIENQKKSNTDEVKKILNIENDNGSNGSV